MRSFCSAIAFLIINSLAAYAGEVTVKGGEHPGFTRVVLEFDQLPDWNTQQIGRSFRITFSNSDLKYDTSMAFHLIDRERVSDIRLIDSGLEFDIACDCTFLVNHVATNALAAEIRPRNSLEPTKVSDVDVMTSPEIEVSGMTLPRTEATKRMAKPAMDSMPKRGDLFDTTNVLHFESEEVSLGLEPSLLTPDRSVAVELLGRQLSRAIAQGLVDADPSITSRTAPNPPVSTGLEDRSNLSVVTGIDRAINPNLNVLPPTATGAVCLPNSLVDVNAWGDSADTHALGQFRTAAVAENGELDREGALRLARFYIAMGFGVEAQNVASALAEKDSGLIHALGDIVDNGYSNATIFDGQVFCEGIVAFWSVLARPKSTEIPANTNQILATFSSLAPHLRSHLGPQLSETLRNAGRNEAARSVINAMTRGGDITNESALAAARLNLDSSLAAEARGTLRDLSVGTDVTAAEALLELLEDAEGRGMAPNPAWITDDVPALVRAIEGTTAAAELNIAGFRGKIALGMFDEFRTELANEGPGLNEASRTELAESALAKAVVEASAAEFIKTEIGLSRIINANILATDLRLGLSERLLALGLPERALMYLLDTTTDSREVELKARVYLGTDDHEAAVQLLEESRQTATQLDLLGMAYRESGDNQRSISAFAAADNTQAAISSALQSGTWDWISDLENEQIAPPIRNLSTPAPMPDTNGELIEVSREIRDQARTLLDLTKPTSFDETFMN